MSSKKRFVIFIVTLLIFTKGFSQDCSVDFFFRSYTGDGFKTGGWQGDRLTILPDSSMLICNSRFIARISQKGDVLWSKLFSGYGGNTSNAIADYDGTIVCVMGSDIIKIDTSGNTLFQKKIYFDNDGGYDVTYSESFRDIAILDDGDKVILYEDHFGAHGGYLLRLDKDMTVIKWCKNIRYNSIGFTNIVIDGNKIVLAGLSAETFNPAAFCFLASFDSNNGSLIKANYFSCLNLGSLDRLYKGNGQYFLMGTLLNQTYEEGRYCYMRINSDFSVLAIRRFVGYTDYFGTTFSFAPQNNNSLYGMIGRGSFVTTMFNIDKNDSVKWVKDHLMGGFPGDIKQNSEGLYFAADWDYNAVGIGPKSTFTICKADFDGNVPECMTKFDATLVTNKYDFFTVAPVTLQLTDKICTIGTDNSTVNNYPLDAFQCSYQSVCNSIKLMGDTGICNVQPVYFTGRRNATCNSPIIWSVSPAADYTVLNDSMISVNFNNNGNYKVKSKISDRCNDYIDSVNVHVNLSGLLAMPADSILCTGNTIKLSAGSQFKSYKWQDGSSDSFFVVNQTGKYFITVTDYCDNTYSDTININPANFYFNTGNDTIKCNADSITLNASSGFYNYQWSSQNNLIAVSDSSVVVSPLVDTWYTATAEKMPGCFVKDSIHVAVLHSPTVFLGNDTSLCAGQSLLLDAGNNFSFYKWSTGDVSAAIKVNDSGSYFIKATAANGCSSEDTLAILTVHPLPDFTLGRDTILCEGKKLSYNFNLPGAAYLWNSGSSAGSNTLGYDGLYWLKVTQQGCSAIDTVNVSFQPSPVVYLGRDTVLCNGITRQLDAVNYNAIYVWQDGSTMPSYIVKKSGFYYVTVDISGCKASDSVYINYKSKPDISLVKDTFVCRGQEVILNPVSGTVDNYLWQDGSTNISLRVKDPGIYTLTASNECGITTSSVNVDWGTCDLYMPAAFTPNNDGINDLFRVKNMFVVREFNFSIYSRFGEKIFASNNINHGWDGSYKGVLQNTGAFVWTISFVDSNNIRKFARGTVLLVR
ncbi:gliding motility-associated C-terminal domain-containing protein [Ferruginibacter paludis]|uniref:T9SS type B sorting domain-containing protein n=1 Tax=Ferruginibacter paludis TaxID=1310417 RepID=UPI0025B2B8C0|nr:gliding motility-associated C-terminal domain-containing protein [Ferruginibacter paludis]MDN3656745.1 gliding motility-associated C-terminal domain-containing protein [Ferruginibacter paludis]